MTQTVRELAFQAIQDILNDNAYSNLKINEILSNEEISSIDKPLFTELVYGTIKRKLTLDFYLKPFIKTKVKGWVRQLLWMSLYQYIYLDKVPNHAIINEAVDIAKRRGGPHNGNIVNGILRTIFRSDLPSIDTIKNEKQRMSIQYSVPKWIIEHWITHHGIEQTHKIANAFLEQTANTVRVNTSRISPEKMVARIQDEGYEVEIDNIIPYCLHLKDKPVVESLAFKEGLISIQDKSSMFVGYFMDVKPNDEILDTCSAPGGKACHMAELLSPNGHVDATDVHKHKIGLIKENIRKLQLKNITTFDHDATTPYKGMYDKILVDAPCSGLGVLRHKPEIKYVQSQQSINDLVELQLEILDNVKGNLKPGGTLIYSTCTIEQLENENVIYTFLKRNKDFEFEPITHPITGEQVKTLQILPQDFDSDGFFITKIKRKES
ncbi:16S rRNA (cytosine(967)-C(5))-methyltransferase RsmB [Staphylococcus petrasii]|uniref:16S rRNA (cytosine(967)-C(5))-methyltransferase RsmB n=1 Tax=Staphylococcus petrasii TaxID=1276936 RepID=UPI001F5617A3|nr:16S rRNA (cytosine(967)-C(5))-methyltransferase RsmB [Staphylococcus petrasii]MCI2773246.1 16S rRNA (cytosine(967)-C(5))-methyltransferase RsmB [Staphylococcus petrasii]